MSTVWPETIRVASYLPVFETPASKSKNLKVEKSFPFAGFKMQILFTVKVFDRPPPPAALLSIQ